MSASSQLRPLRCILAVLATALLLPLPNPQHGGSGRIVAGQGLDVVDQLLGAGAAAAAAEFDIFEDGLALSSAGGRGRGGRGGSGTLGSGGFRDAKDFEQLQATAYYVGGSPRVYESSNPRQTPAPYNATRGLNYVPQPNDQNICNSCVGQAVTTAVQMSLAYTLRRNVSQLAVSPLALYYCAPGGRTCRTGWDILPALSAVESNPQWLQPTKCFNSALTRVEADVDDWTDTCARSSVRSADKDCRLTVDKPKYRCTYKSLSSFYQVQQHIRKHGAVITRLQVPDDFNVQFNYTVRGVSGLKLPPYTRNITAKPAFGHAAVIVGYDNLKYTWTILNSWGSGKDAKQTRINGGVTADGMFKVQMGLLGVGTPDKTYGVLCEPANGTADNMHSERPWLSRRRRPVTSIPGEPTCYSYTARKGDTVAAITDHFEVDIREFIAMNKGAVGAIANLTYKFTDYLRAEEMSRVLSIVTNATQKVAAARPFFTCWFYDAAGKQTAVTCDGLTPAENAKCDVKGTVGCTLNYQDVNVTESLLAGRTIKVCNEQWTTPGAFERVAYRTDAMFPINSIPATEVAAAETFLRRVAPNLNISANGYLFACAPDGQLIPATFVNEKSVEVKLQWALYCSGGHVTGLSCQLRGPDTAPPQDVHPPWTDDLLYPLLDLANLETLQLTVYNGTLSPQLGALKNLRFLDMRYYCLHGTLPPTWFNGWGKSIDILRVIPAADAVGFTDPTGAACGITGPLPKEYAKVASSISELNLQSNQLAGELPTELYNWRYLRYLYLQNNKFTGQLPRSWSQWSNPPASGSQLNGVISQIDVSNNLLEGLFPLNWRVGFPNGLNYLKYLYLDNNKGLQGCVRADAYSFVTYSGTGLSGVCKGDNKDIEANQASALNITLPLLLQRGKVQVFANSQGSSVLVNDSSRYDEAIDRLLKLTRGLGSLVGQAQSSRVLTDAEIAFPGKAIFSVTVQVFQGTEYVTQLFFQNVALNLTHLPALFQQLPLLQSFVCYDCNRGLFVTPGANDLILPPGLASARPNLTEFRITNSGLIGTLPQDFGQWKNLKVLWLGGNRIAGSVPAGWAGMSSLVFLELQMNRLTGTLPAEWGAVGQMPTNLQCYLSSNTGIMGTVPDTYAYFSAGYLDLRNTSINKDICKPGSMVVLLSAETGADLWPSSCQNSYKTSVDLLALTMLGELFKMQPTKPSALDVWDYNNAGDAGPGTPPRYCRSWPGVTCDASYHITGLDLSVVGLVPPFLAFAGQGKPLVDMYLRYLTNQVLANLTTLESLIVPGLDLIGTLPDDLAVTFPNLQHLNISGNPRISSTLPNMWLGLTALKVLDVSGCGIQGSLPATYATMQQLQLFRAAECPDLSGALPEAYGILKSLRVLEISGSQLSGELPAVWGQPTAMAAVGASTLAAVKAVADAAAQNADKALAGDGSASAAALPATLVPQADVSVKPTAGVQTSRLRVQAVAASRAVQVLQAALANITTSAGTALQVQLQELRLPRNRLSGRLPESFANFVQLAVLDLSDNSGLSGPLPAGWFMLQNLKVLRLANTTLDGPLPMSYAGLTLLQELDVSFNRLNGSLPQEYASLRNLTRLDLSSNGWLSGTVPDGWKFLASKTYKLECMLLYGTGLQNLAATQSQLEANSKLNVIIATDDAACIKCNCRKV